MPLAPRLIRTLNAVALIALIGWIGIDLLGKTVFGDRPWPDGVIDFRLIYDYSRHLLETHRYPAVFPHPPSAVVIQSAATRWSFPVSAAIWVALTGAIALAIYMTLTVMLRRDGRPTGFLLALVAHAAAAYFLQWELRSLNCNLIFLAALVFAAAALQRDHPRLAAVWLALSISLKLYTILALPYLAWTGRKRAFAWTLAGLAVFWIVLPAVVFGRDVVTVYQDWFAQMARAANPLDHAPHPILISLTSAASWLANGDATSAGWIVNAVRGVWLIAIAGVFWTARSRPAAPNDGERLFADFGLLTLAPIAVSPYLEPYHGVPFVIPAILLASAAFDSRRSNRSRWLAAVLLLAAAAIVPAQFPWAVRGLVVNAKLFIAAAGAVIVSRIDRATANPNSIAADTRRAA